MSAYHRRLTGSDEKVKQECATAWSVWYSSDTTVVLLRPKRIFSLREMTTSRLYVDPDYVARAADDDAFALAFARIECHYFVHGGFFKVEQSQPHTNQWPLINSAHLCSGG